jgi:hypothetical protein
VGPRRPGLIVETVLPSITSSQLSVTSLDWDGEFEYYPEIDYPVRTMAERQPPLLTKCLNAGNTGEKMRIEQRGTGCGEYGGSSR